MNPSFLKTIALLLLVSLAAIVGHFYDHDWPNVIDTLRVLGPQFQGSWRFPIDGAMGLLTVAVMWFTATGLGLLALTRPGASGFFPSRLQQAVFAVLIGWVFLALGTLMLGLAGLCNRTALGLFLIAGAALAAAGWTRFFRDLPGSAGEDDPIMNRQMEDFRMPRSVMILYGVIILLAVPYALTPSVESDGLRYHLAAPEAYLEAGRIFYLPRQAFSNFPFLMEMLYTMAMALQGHEGAKLIHLSMLDAGAALTGLTAFLMIQVALAGHRLRRSAYARQIAALSGAAFALIPSVVILACWAWVDIATVAYFLAFVYLGALAIIRRRPPPAWLAGMITAGALGIKYSMLPIVAALGLLLPWLVMLGRKGEKRETRSLVGYFTRAALVAVILASPWFVKNAIFTGNPVYPLAYGIFGGGEWSEENAQFWAEKNSQKGLGRDVLGLLARRERERRGADRPRPYLPGEKWLIQHHPLPRGIEFLLTPVTTSIYGFAFEDQFFGPTPLMAMALIFFGCFVGLRKKRPRWLQRRTVPLAIWFGTAIAIYWVLWFVTFQSNRLLLPAIALVCAGGGWGAAMLLAAISDRSPDIPRPFMAAFKALLALAAIFSLTFTAVQILGYKQPLGVALGFQSAENYLAQRISYYPAAKWLGPKLNEENKALLIGEHRTLYFPNAIVASDWFDTPQPLPLLREAPTNEALFDLLKREKIRYIYFNKGELNKYSDLYFKPRFHSKEEYGRFEAMMRDARLKVIHRDEERDIWIYEIEDPNEGERG